MACWSVGQRKLAIPRDSKKLLSQVPTSLMSLCV